MLAPLVVELTLTLRRNPVPYLLAVAMASNIGSTATITGNPQNMMIGSFSRISYVNFAAALMPVALFGLLLMFAGLFIIVAGAEHSLLNGEVVAAVGRLHLDRLPVLSALTAILSNLVSRGASTGLTVLGSIANLIVVQRAAAAGVVIGLWDYCRVGVPLTLLSLLIGTMWLWI